MDPNDHYRLTFCAGPTRISEAYYETYEESLEDFLNFVRMYWSKSNDDVAEVTLESLAELTGYGERQAAVIGTASQNIWWRRCEPGTETVSLN